LNLWILKQSTAKKEMKNTEIFIVNHHLAQGTFLKYHMNLNGFKNVRLYQNYDECLYTIQKDHTPQFMVMDCTDSISADLKFIQLIHKYNSAIRIIIFSENDNPENVRQFFNAGITDYIVKLEKSTNRINELISNLQFIIKKENLMR